MHKRRSIRRVRWAKLGLHPSWPPGTQSNSSFCEKNCCDLSNTCTVCGTGSGHSQRRIVQGTYRPRTFVVKDFHSQGNGLRTFYKKLRWDQKRGTDVVVYCIAGHHWGTVFSSQLWPMGILVTINPHPELRRTLVTINNLCIVYCMKLLTSPLILNTWLLEKLFSLVRSVDWAWTSLTC
jgi:hypothetical protein